MMKILIVTQHFYPENFKINDLCSVLIKNGNDLTILTGKPNYPKGKYYNGYSFFSKHKELYDGAKIIRVPVLARGDGSSLRLFFNYLTFAFFGSLFCLFHKKKYDFSLVFAVSPITSAIPAIVSRLIYGNKMVLWVLDLWPESIEVTGRIQNSFIKKKIKMDSNITILIEIKKTNLGYSSFLFNDRVLGWAGYENSKKRFKSKSDLWTLQSTFNWANKKINQNKVLKKTNAKILIDKFFKLTGIKRTKVLFSLNHGWKYSSNSKPLKLKSYWNSRLNLGVCADWFNGPRLESGWISANDLYKKINT